MRANHLYPVAYSGETFLKRNSVGNFYQVNEEEKQYEPIDLVAAIRLYCLLTNAVISFESAFELEN